MENQNIVTLIDEEGAESLSGSGDALMRSPEYNNTLVRLQGYYTP